MQNVFLLEIESVFLKIILKSRSVQTHQFINFTNYLLYLVIFRPCMNHVIKGKLSSNAQI